MAYVMHAFFYLRCCEYIRSEICALFVYCAWLVGMVGCGDYLSLGHDAALWALRVPDTQLSSGQAVMMLYILAASSSLQDSTIPLQYRRGSSGSALELTGGG